MGGQSKSDRSRWLFAAYPTHCKHDSEVVCLPPRRSEVLAAYAQVTYQLGDLGELAVVPEAGVIRALISVSGGTGGV